MRAGGCSVQQALTAEAASIVKQAVSLARRRGHSQVTPLHVANTMLSSSTGLLRTACLQSHSHPLQCKALELCFNVALNRLPAATSSPILGPHSHHLSLSNALVAAFKRAQAHQRRGSIENQQQPLLAVKIEIERLIISILDDPSVSRVMREAGFSSTQVKCNVEKTVSLEICAPNPSINNSKEGNLLVLGTSVSPYPSPLSQFGVKVGKVRPLDQPRSEDVMSVVENLVSRRRRNIVIVGECLASSENVVRGVMEKVDKEEVPEALRNVQFISIPPFSFGHLSKGEVEHKLGEIRCLVKGCVGRGVILFLGDLRWAAEYRANSNEQRRNYNCPVEHMILELGRIVCGIGESGRLWLMGIATYQTYMRCKIGHPSLETLWGLHPLTVPADSLGLSLTPDSDSKCQLPNRTGDEFGWSFLQDELEKLLTCCPDCVYKFKREVRSMETSTTHHNSFISINSSLPSWLQQYKDENKRLASNEKECLQVRELCKKWNSICNSTHKLHHPTERTLNFTSISQSSSVSSYDQHFANLHHQMWRTAIDAKQPLKEHHFWISDTVDEGPEPNLTSYIPEHMETRLALCANPNPNSTSSSDAMEMEYLHRFKELNAENLKSLCKSLEEKVSWQKDIIPEIASMILQCRSGMVRRKGNLAVNETKEDTWLFFEGGDTEAKEKIARELAFLIFGSQETFISIGLSRFSSPRSDCTDDFRNKRSRDESSYSFLERFADSIGSSQHCVFFLEDIEQIDCYSQMGIKRAIERGRIRNSNGDEIQLGDAIIILCCESFDARSRASSRASSPPSKQKLEIQEEDEIECAKEISPCVSLDLNLSFEDTDCLSFDDIGLLSSVDGRFVFRSPNM